MTISKNKNFKNIFSYLPESTDDNRPMGAGKGKVDGAGLQSAISTAGALPIAILRTPCEAAPTKLASKAFEERKYQNKYKRNEMGCFFFMLVC